MEKSGPPASYGLPVFFLLSVCWFSSFWVFFFVFFFFFFFVLFFCFYDFYIVPFDGPGNTSFFASLG